MPFACRPHTELKKLRTRCHDDGGLHLPGFLDLVARDNRGPSREFYSAGEAVTSRGIREESWTGASVLCAGWESNNESPPDSRKHPTQTPRAGAISPKSPVRSHTITSVENGVLAAAANKPA